MKLPEILFMLLLVGAFSVNAHISVILQPLQSLLGWQGALDVKNLSLPIENVGAAAEPELSRAKAQVDQPTPVELSKIPERKPLGPGQGAETPSVPIKDSNSTTPSEQRSKAASPADSPDQTHSTSSLATKTTTTLSGHSTSVTSSQARATSVGNVSEPIVGAKTFHLDDLKTQGGENPDAEKSPDVASPKELSQPPASAETNTANLSLTADPTPSESKPEHPTVTREALPAATLAPAREFLPTPPLESAAPSATTAQMVAASDVSLGPSPVVVPKSATSTGESVQSQPDQPAARRFVFQDINDLFQSDD